MACMAVPYELETITGDIPKMTLLNKSMRNIRKWQPSSFVVALLLLAVPAHADDTPDGYDPLILQSCVETQSVEMRSACIGMAANRCTYGPGGASTVGTVLCLDAELRQWDTMLNEAYQQLSARDEAADEEMGDELPAVPRLAPSLRDMQRAWIAFRDAACTYEAAQWGGGSGAGPATSNCLMQMTARQALALQARVAAYEMNGQ